ncbi:MAG: hypothetical protein JKY65_08615, partial [Planctomycetes bacterium]|nr:hypothetical protein [Planctomycetota bacterium]
MEDPSLTPDSPDPAAARERARDAGRVLRLAAVFVALAWLWRVLLLFGRVQGQLAWVDLRGFLVDAWLAILLGVAVSGRRYLAAGAALVWGALNYVVFQHVDVLGVLPNVQHAEFLGDATFLEGSVKSVRFLPLLILTLLMGPAGAWWAA